MVCYTVSGGEWKAVGRLSNDVPPLACPKRPEFEAFAILLYPGKECRAEPRHHQAVFRAELIRIAIRTASMASRA